NQPDTGCETDVSASATNCGACGAACPATAPNAAPTCAMGTCALNCKPGFGDCDGVASNGCEVDFSNDNKNCTMCGKACMDPTPACIAGQCASDVTNCATNPKWMPVNCTTMAWVWSSDSTKAM